MENVYKFNQNILKIRELGEASIFNHDFYFHSIVDNNLIKLECILKLGLLSKDMQNKKRLPIPYACEQYPDSEQFVFLTKFSSAESSLCHSLIANNLMHKVSFVIDKKDLDEVKSLRGEFFPTYYNEVLVQRKVDNKRIAGLVIPSDLLFKQIKDLDCFSKDFHCYNNQNFDDFIKLLNIYFNVNVDDSKIKETFASILSFLNICKPRKDLVNDITSLSYHRIDNIPFLNYLSTLMQEGWNKKLGLDYNVTIKDVVIYIKNKYPNLKLYNEIGIEYDNIINLKEKNNKEFTR